MSNTSYDYLSDIYDSLSKDSPAPTIPKHGMMNSSIGSPKMALCKRHISNNCDNYRNQLSHDIVTDIYKQTLPMDTEYKDGNMKMVYADIDSYLKDKDMNSYQYLRSAYEKTKSPLLEFIINHIDDTVSVYKEETEADLSGDPEDIDPIPDPEEIPSKNKDIKADIEYSTFIDKLKKKIMDKIVKDIIDIIEDKQEEKNMNFNINKNESCMYHCINFMTESAIKSGKDFNMDDEMLGLAIRESVLRELDILFKFERSDVKLFSDKLYKNRGIVINNS